MTLLENLQWRYAAKAYDPEKKVAKDKIIEAARLAPHFFGLSAVSAHGAPRRKSLLLQARQAIALATSSSGFLGCLKEHSVISRRRFMVSGVVITTLPALEQSHINMKYRWTLAD